MPENSFLNGNCPIISIIVITYNSSKFVLETLESAKAQTYQNIELIISDDCSTDNTVEICHHWLEKNKDRFINVKEITVSQNSGIPANCNRGVRAAQGEWIKLIAGDDLLLPDAISNNISFIQNRDESVNFLFSEIKKIDDYGQELKSSHISIEERRANAFFEETANKQYLSLIKGGVFIPAATNFIKRQVIIYLGWFDEEIKLCEDYPMWIIATHAGFKLSKMETITVKYRVHQNSVMGNISPNYQRSLQKVFFKYRLRPLLRIQPFKAIELLIWNLTRTNNRLNRIVPFILPGTYLNWLRNK